jgi:hypothetical protein
MGVVEYSIAPDIPNDKKQQLAQEIMQKYAHVTYYLSLIYIAVIELIICLVCMYAYV